VLLAITVPRRRAADRRELEMLRLLAAVRSNQRIAHDLVV
jgi:ATP/maltotriose-dependent transcriptional regulator MalT